MHQTIEATTDQKGHIHLLEKVALPPSARVLITILDDSERDGWSNLSLSSAMEGMESEEEVDYSLSDIQEPI
ncbi:MAG: hypothetical protein HOK69_02855 [Gammaproteobacteria bacterium]|jgi:uncharacterized lipoprotein YbaY|nr:hypothetical protein [Gammaproteobacteria bacterium]MBT7684794.1 hypothetical protein [Candidatus Neomarinimicrobiota bacterium]